MPKIIDLHYKIVRIPTVFTRGGYAIVWYRHGRDGLPYFDGVETYFGDDLRAIRKVAYKEARDVVWRRRSRSPRSFYITAAQAVPIRKALPELIDPVPNRIRGER